MAALYLEIMKETWLLLKDASPYLLFGFLIAGIIHVYMPEEKIQRFLGKDSLSSVVRASIIGAPLPLCSCGVAPTATKLYRDGASSASTLSFLIATPETGVDSISITYALLDPVMTVFRPVAAVATAVFAGVLEMATGDSKIERNNHRIRHIEGCDRCEYKEEDSKRPALERILSYAFFEFLGDVSRWLILGFIAAGVVAALFPQTIFETYLGGTGLIPMVAMLVIGVPMYICASASTPIAAALIAKGLSPGAALVFLLAGPATNMATITMVLKHMGKKTAAVYLTGITIATLTFGIILNALYSALKMDPTAALGRSAEVVPEKVAVLSAILFMILLINSLRSGEREP
ncbi:MAG: permease [Methanobacteriota archaeon]|nr:MAG: permease [Euryarchaeota archaeon]